METIGEILKNKRETKNLTFEYIYEETGILVEHLKALENNDFFHFPNKVYARSFLRDYANYLCLDTYSLLRIFEEEYAKIKAENEPNDDIAEVSELPTAGSFLNKTVGIFVVFILLCLGAYLIGKNTNTDNIQNKNNIPVQTEKQNGETFIPVTVKPDAKQENINIPKTEDKVEKALKEADEKANKEIAKAKETKTVTIYAHKNLWVRVKVDGKSVLEGTIKPGAHQEFQVKNSISVRGGEPSACQINVEGKSIGKLGVSGKPFDLTLYPKTGAVIKQ